ncbi:FoF1 ATP synthase subunit delta/epsilon [[Acholeplasma] multilocale]|uniref:FoF1 ATP synthase subunit delta/epsilon n=1 Tax=[Acholeplasma] multilocale TaxID=264638 RepID=UPI000414E6D8|nr:F0F1 ATP synthase subunit epsilon [[Acholeplasma] multilocale]
MGIKLKVVTPDGIFIEDKEVDIVNIQSVDGDMGILQNMIPLVTALKIGTTTFRVGDKVTRVHMHRGLVTVDGKQCKIITERLYLVDEQGRKIDTPQKLV